MEHSVRLQRGAALVEFALISSLLILLLFGIIEVGLILGDQAQVGAAAREAARAASVGGTVEAAQASAVNAGSGLHLATGSVYLEQSVPPSPIWIALGDTVDGSSNNAVTGSLIRATVTYSHPLVTTLIFSGSTRTLTSKMVMQRE